MHPELFELKALVAGRLDAHRRREIDDHLGTCADCSRHYVALMLGSASPKTAEAEARQGRVPSSTGLLSFAAAGGVSDAPAYGIDAPLAAQPSRPPVTRPPHSNLAALETEFVPPVSRAQVPVSTSFVDAITQLRAESEQGLRTAATAAAKTLERPAAAQAAQTSIIPAPQKPIVPKSHVLPPFLQDGPVESSDAAPELVVTFSSTPTRFARRRIVTPPAPVEAASYAPPVLRAAAQSPAEPFGALVGAVAAATAPAVVEPMSPFVLHHGVASPFDSHSADVLHAERLAHKPKSMMLGALAGGVVFVLVVVAGGIRYFQSSVSQAAATAGAAAARQVEATAARTAAGLAATVAARGAAPVQTRIVYVREPAKKEDEARPVETRAALPNVPIAVTLPDVNLQTSGLETGVNVNSQRSATSELTRSARATAARTTNPRP